MSVRNEETADERGRLSAAIRLHQRLCVITGPASARHTAVFYATDTKYCIATFLSINTMLLRLFYNYFRNTVVIFKVDSPTYLCDKEQTTKLIKLIDQ